VPHYIRFGRQLAEFDRALAGARASGCRLQTMRAADLPLPTLAAKIAGWRREVAQGRGFVVIQGLPVERWGPDDSALVFYGLGLHLGVPGAQNPQYSELLPRGAAPRSATKLTALGVAETLTGSAARRRAAGAGTTGTTATQAQY
jgi:hypothetical protein